MSPKTYRTRVLAGVAVAGLTAAALVGCSTPGGGNSSDKTLTVATNGGTAMKTVIKKFEDANPGVTVQIKDSPDSYAQVTATQLTGGNAPDVLQIFEGSSSPVGPVQAGAKGYLTDLSGSSWASQLPASAKSLLSDKSGKLLAVPMTFSSIGGVYNVGAMKSVGLTAPTTWPEVLQFCKSAKAKGKIAYGLGLTDTWTTQLIPYALVATLVYANDPEFVKKQAAGTATFSDSGWKTAMAKYQAMSDAGCFNKSPAGTAYATVQHAVASGSTLATVTVAAETAAIKKLGAANLDLEYELFPAADTASANSLSATYGPAFAINAKAPNQALAKKFVAYLASPATQVAYATAYGDTAAMPGNLKQDSQVAQLVTSYVKSGKVAAWPDAFWPSSAIQPAMFSGVQAVFSGQGTAASMLATMDADFKAAS